MPQGNILTVPELSISPNFLSKLGSLPQAAFAKRVRITPPRIEEAKE
jgi:hypothetical protein